jgi:hypothetical protein
MNLNRIENKEHRMRAYGRRVNARRPVAVPVPELLATPKSGERLSFNFLRELMYLQPIKE